VPLGNLAEAVETTARMKAIEPAFDLAEFAETQPIGN
jgi:hypothetical protein